MTLPITLLIVDDSRVFRNAVQMCLSDEEDIQVIGSVHNGEKALSFIEKQRPDVVSLDVEMPGISGLETLEAIQEINRKNPLAPPIGVIMLSALTSRGTDATIEALTIGAFDFITKPDNMDTGKNFELLRRRLAVKIRHYASQVINKKGRLSSLSVEHVSKKALSVPVKSMPTRIKAVLIGVSTGGPKVLVNMLPLLCDQLSIPILLVQHMPPDFTASLAGNLNRKCSYTVKEADNNEPVLDKHVYIAPGGKHMLLAKQNNSVVLITSNQPPDSGYRPSVNVLFHSAAVVYGGDTIALILTGMGDDGTRGAGILKKKGTTIFVQDEASSVVWGMPGNAVKAGCVDEIVPLYDIPSKVYQAIYQ